MFLSMFESPATAARREKMHREAIARRMECLTDWSPAQKWQPELNIRAASYKVLDLFPELSPVEFKRSKRLVDMKEGIDYAASSGGFIYVKRRLPGGSVLSTICGSRQGSVVFDEEVAIPCLLEPQRSMSEPWMSITPMEILSLRAGTKLARGRVIVAGLGLGHQLVEVAKRRSVTHVTLVERKQEVVDLIMPRLTPHLAQPVKVIVGDAYDVIPKLEADVALLDIFPHYGGNAYERDKLARKSPSVKKMWAWGAASIGDGGW